MSDPVKEHVERLVEQIFQNRRDQDQKVLHEQLESHTSDHVRRGVLKSGMYYAGVGRIFGHHFTRIIDQTLDQLEQDFRQANRRDGTYFWNIVDTKLKQLADSIKTGLNNGAVSYASEKSGADPNSGSLAARGYSQYGDQAWSGIHTRVNELRLRTQFITMKSAADRKANDIPDVAVMMWFPNAETDGQDKVDRANQKFNAIREAVATASRGLASVDKIDNPALVHKDRISPSVEVWLAKSVVVICDLEGNRANVFYEFGFARAMGTDVVAIRPDGEKTDFHLAQWNIDSYRGFDELKQKITPRIEKVLSKYDLHGNLG